MRTEQLRDILDYVDRAWPGAIITRNRVGDLSLVHEGTFVGWINVRFAELHDVDDGLLYTAPDTFES